MIITVIFHTVLQKQTPEGKVDRVQLELPSGIDLKGLISKIDISIDPDHVLFVINGRTAGMEQIIQEGDEIHLIPAIAGG